MKSMIAKSITAATFLAIFSGCGQSTPNVFSQTQYDECARINKRLIEVDTFLVNVERTSAFHLEETALAFRRPDISNSNNKKDMLKDGEQRKKELMAESQKYKCKSYKK